jgi:DNA-binding transcriptional ArsR family regulator
VLLLRESCWDALGQSKKINRNCEEKMTNPKTYQPGLDYTRLANQLQKVAVLMADREWRTLEEISRDTGAPQASASARLRALRAAGNTVERKRIKDPMRGLWVYRVLPPLMLLPQNEPIMPAEGRL